MRNGQSGPPAAPSLGVSGDSACTVSRCGLDPGSLPLRSSPSPPHDPPPLSPPPSPVRAARPGHHLLGHKVQSCFSIVFCTYAVIDGGPGVISSPQPRAQLLKPGGPQRREGHLSLHLSVLPSQAQTRHPPPPTFSPAWPLVFAGLHGFVSRTKGTKVGSTR